QRQLRQGPRSGTEDDATAVGQVEGRLVAGAEQVVGGPLVERDRAAHVGADLGVGDDAVDGPVLPATAVGDVVGLHAEEQHRTLGLADVGVDAVDQVV